MKPPSPETKSTPRRPWHLSACQSPLCRAFTVALVIGWATLATRGAESDTGVAQNQLTDAESKAGWLLLFDGRTTAGWRSVGKEGFPTQGWAVADGCLKHLAKGGGGDVITTHQFTDFEFSFDWRLGPGANSGVKYLLRQGRAGIVGHEYQLWDEPNQTVAARPGKGSTAGFYDVLPPRPHQPLRANGEFNRSRIVVRGEHVEHWLNDEKVLEYELGSAAVKGSIADSKFKGVSGFGTRTTSPLLLQDHGGEVWFRNLKLRKLPAG